VIVTLLTFGKVSGNDAAAGKLFENWGFVPARWHQHAGLTLITCFFIHAGWWHLVGNMYFLLILGDNVEDSLRPPKYLLLLLVSHLVGMLAHGLLTHDATLPCVGASAGISGIIAFYAVLQPNVRLGILFRYYFLLRWLHVRAIWALVLYMGLQAIGAYLQVRGFSAVSYVAHLGGLGVGVTAALLHKAALRRELRQAIAPA
jgi:membrane associated rhomboid family serine protease